MKKENIKLSEILGMFQKKIYKYSNAETAIFINNKKYIISKEIKIIFDEISNLIENDRIGKKIETADWVLKIISILKIEDKKNGVIRPENFETNDNKADRKYQPYCELAEIILKNLKNELTNILRDVYDFDDDEIDARLA